MESPNADAIREAMKFDLGVSRVDDLELENGQKGKGIRLGQGTGGIVLPVAKPRNLIPALANKWKMAIQQGEFDDDDAEMVKGLDRIGGGRLHAINSAPPKPPIVSKKRPLPGPGPGPGSKHAMPATTKRPTGSSAKSAPTGSQDARGDRGPPPTHTFAPRYTHSEPPPPPPTENRKARPSPKRQGSTPLAGPMMPPPRPPVPEPTEYVVKVDLEVNDRQAQGKGIAYVTAPTGNEPAKVFVFVEGAIYLDYAVGSMFNYFTDSTTLSLQFKDEGGLIVTTALVMKPQSKMIDLMQVIKKMKTAKPTTAPATTAKATAPVPAAASPERAPSQQTPVPAPAETSAPAPATSSPPAAQPAPPQHAIMASDLVDLSDFDEAPISRQSVYANHKSAYSAALESLCSSPQLSCASPRAIDESPAQVSMSSGFEPAPSHSTTTDPISCIMADLFGIGNGYAASAPAPTLAMESPVVPKEEPAPPQVEVAVPQKPQAEEEKPLSEKKLLSDQEVQETLQASLKAVLSNVQTIDEILAACGEDGMTALTAALAKLRASDPSYAEMNGLQSARFLFSALGTPVRPQVTTVTGGPRYTETDVLGLRDKAVIPAELPEIWEKIKIDTEERIAKMASRKAPSAKAAVRTTKPATVWKHTKTSQTAILLPEAGRSREDEPKAEALAFDSTPEATRETTASNNSFTPDEPSMDTDTDTDTDTDMDTDLKTPTQMPINAAASVSDMSLDVKPLALDMAKAIKGLKSSRWAS